MRQDVTGFFMMLQGAPGAGWGFGPRRGVRWGFRPGHGVCGDSGLGAGWGFGLRVRGGDSGPGREVGWGFGPRARGGDSGPGAEWGFFGVRWEIFYLFAVFRRLGRDLH